MKQKEFINVCHNCTPGACEKYVRCGDKEAQPSTVTTATASANDKCVTLEKSSAELAACPVRLDKRGNGSEQNVTHFTIEAEGGCYA
jgi:hypothetical protein